MQNISVGSVVQVRAVSEDFESDEEEDHVYKGVVSSVTEDRLTLEECTFQGKLLPDCQTFKYSKIKDWQILEQNSQNGASLDSQQLLPSRISCREMSASNRHQSNPHLDKLYPLQMTKLLRQEQYSTPAQLISLASEPGKPKRIPKPIQNHGLPDSSLNDIHKLEMKVVRNRTWRNSETPPDLTAIPSRWYLVQDFDDAFELAIKQIKTHQLFGVSLQAKILSRHGEPSTLNISTPDDVFTFDLLQLGAKIFKTEVGQFLSDSTKMKVFHDCRGASDLLHHKFGIDLKNVYDIQASHSMVLSTTIAGGNAAKYTAPLPHLIRIYLGVEGDLLFFPTYRLTMLEEDMKVWLKRPMPPEIEIGILCSVIFLIDLKKITSDAFLWPIRKLSEIFVDEQKSAVDPEECSSFTLPSSALQVFPSDGSDEIFQENVKFIDNVMEQTNPLIVFSRNCFHQTKRL